MALSFRESFGGCVDSGGRTGKPKQLNSILLSSANVPSVTAEEWLNFDGVRVLLMTMAIVVDIYLTGWILGQLIG